MTKKRLAIALVAVIAGFAVSPVGNHLFAKEVASPSGARWFRHIWILGVVQCALFGIACGAITRRYALCAAIGALVGVVSGLVVLLGARL
jgi:hypothetical protein